MSRKQDTGKCACRACGASFAALRGFDRHRVGEWDERRCLAHAEMQEAGFTQDSRGRWRLPAGERPAHWVKP